MRIWKTYVNATLISRDDQPRAFAVGALLSNEHPAAMFLIIRQDFD